MKPLIGAILDIDVVLDDYKRFIKTRVYSLRFFYKLQTFNCANLTIEWNKRILRYSAVFFSLLFLYTVGAKNKKWKIYKLFILAFLNQA